MASWWSTQTVGVKTAIIGGASGLVIAALTTSMTAVLNSRLEAPQLRNEVATLREQNTELKRKLLPFETASAIFFSGPESERLLKLAAVLNDRVKLLESNVDTIKTKIAPRNITAEQVARFAEFLKTTKKDKMEVIFLSPVPETTQFAQEVAKLIAAAGYPKVEASYHIGATVNSDAPGDWDIGILVDREKPIPAAANIIAGAFQAIGFKVRGIGNAEALSRQTEINILVNAK